MSNKEIEIACIYLAAIESALKSVYAELTRVRDLLNCSELVGNRGPHERTGRDGEATGADSP